MKTRTAALATLLCCGVALAAFAQASDQPIKIALTDDKVGSEPVTFLPMVGEWAVVQDAGKKVLSVDGQQWLRGNAARGLAEKSRAIYGSRYDQFMDNVKAFAYFPYAVATGVKRTQNLRAARPSRRQSLRSSPAARARRQPAGASREWRSPRPPLRSAS